jgi:hypothetical protein
MIDSITDKKMGNNVIRIPFDEKRYFEIFDNPVMFREYIDKMAKQYPELFPPEITKGYIMKDIYRSKKMPVSVRRIKIADRTFTLHPSFVLPYLTGRTSDVDRALFLRKFDVPFWALANIFGKDPMYWYRIEQTLGRNSIVGTTVKKPENLPNNIDADEKHSWIRNNKVYIATTVGDGCVLGVSVAEDAGEESLTRAYGVFKEEVRCLYPEYKPQTVNTDGWKATQNAWKYLFPSVVVICCFLHMYIKIRDRAKKKFAEIFHEISQRLWDCYKSENKRTFSQRVRRLHEWAKNMKIPSVLLKTIEKLHKNISSFSASYDNPGCHRTSNMLERIMQRMDRHLFSNQYFHGSLSSAELNIRGWALIHNFAPSNPQTVKKYAGLVSPAERINGFRYHTNWLENMLISASMGGYNIPPRNQL